MLADLDVDALAAGKQDLQGLGHDATSLVVIEHPAKTITITTTTTTTTGNCLGTSAPKH
jgi:hypothetical protein